MSTTRAAALAAGLAVAAGVLRPTWAPVETAGARPAESITAAGTASADRSGALTRAHVWLPPRVAPAAADFTVNPPGPGAFAADADVDCTFVVEGVGGSTPKFVCALADGERVKVKYGTANGELPAEVAATRLLSALGFPTDRMYRVHSVRCRGCPLLPHVALLCLAQGGTPAVCLHGATPAMVVTFAPAVIERPLSGKKIGTDADEGWAWYELDRISAKAGGSPRAEVDALRLMAMVLAHWDNKAANQKLLCRPEDERAGGACRAPIAFIKDLGSTFGPWKVDLSNWSRVPVWADARTCRVSMKALPFSGATFADVQISEQGRRFLLQLLRQITRDQLIALFDASGFTSFPHVLATAHQPAPWADAFLDKVRQIEDAGPCPAHP